VPKHHRYFVYILSNRSRTLYIGVTNDLVRRIYEHKNKLVEGFTKTYNITQLVYFEETSNVRDAIAREKQLKGWLRAGKLALIEAENPQWKDFGPGLLSMAPDPSLRSG
jgi:putative endonuclease